METRQERPNRVLIGCTFLCILCWLVAFSRGHGTSVDEGHVYETARALVERRSWQLEEPLNERRYSRYSPLPSLLAAALYATGRVLGGSEVARVWAYQLNAVTTAAAAVCLMLAAARLGASRAAAVFVAFSYGLASLATPYAGSLYSQPLAAALVAGCMVLSCGTSTALLAICWALAIWCRAELLLLTPAFACFAALARGRAVRAWAAYGFGALAGVVLWAATNLLRGDPLFAGSYGEEGFVGDVLRGIYGLSVSAGKGLLLFSPLSALGVLAGTIYRPIWWRPLLGAVLAYMFLIAGWWTWHGGYCWGPRLLLPVLPVLHLSLALLWDSTPTMRKTWSALLVGLGCLQLFASGMHPYEERVGPRSGLATESEHIFVPSLSPLWISHRQVADWWWLSSRAESAGRIPRAALAGGLVLIGLLCLLYPARVLLKSQGGVEVRRPWSGWQGAGAVLLVVGIAWGTILDGVAGVVASPPQRSATLVVFAPVRGIYTFHLPRLASGELAQMTVDGRTIRAVPRGTWADYVAQLDVGEHRVRLAVPVAVNELFWTSPGGVFYKEPVPVLYLGTDRANLVLGVLRAARGWGWFPVVLGVYLLCWTGPDGRRGDTS